MTQQEKLAHITEGEFMSVESIDPSSVPTSKTFTEEPLSVDMPSEFFQYFKIEPNKE